MKMPPLAFQCVCEKSEGIVFFLSQMECFIPSAIAIKSPLKRDFEWSLIHLLCVYCLEI